MKLWIARFVFDNGYCYHQYELIVAALDSSEARLKVYAWGDENCRGNKSIDYRTLTIDEINIAYSGVLEVFDRGVI